MELRALGSTGIMVSPIGLGTVKLGRDRGVKYPTPVRIPTDEQARALLATARTLGVNLIDTAPAYGNSEQRLGGLLEGQRDEWIICTKVGESFADGVSAFDFTPEGIASSLDRSLARLRTDRVDILLAHSDGQIEHELVSSGLLDAMRLAQSQGKARAIGVSTKTLAGAILTVEHCDVVMLTYNPSFTKELPAISLAEELGRGVLVKKALASGYIQRLPKPAGRDPAANAVRIVLETPGVSSAIIGTTNPGHLAAACEAVVPPGPYDRPHHGGLP